MFGGFEVISDVSGHFVADILRKRQLCKGICEAGADGVQYACI